MLVVTTTTTTAAPTATKDVVRAAPRGSTLLTGEDVAVTCHRMLHFSRAKQEIVVSSDIASAHTLDVAWADETLVLSLHCFTLLQLDELLVWKTGALFAELSVPLDGDGGTLERSVLQALVQELAVTAKGVPACKGGHSNDDNYQQKQATTTTTTKTRNNNNNNNSSNNKNNHTNDNNNHENNHKINSSNSINSGNPW